MSLYRKNETYIHIEQNNKNKIKYNPTKAFMFELLTYLKQFLTSLFAIKH